MAFTYNFQTAPQLSQVRSMIPDTVAPGIFSDDEINNFLFLESSQGLYVSGQAVVNGTATNPQGMPQIYSVRRAAAMALDSIASKLARMAAVEQLLDVRQACAAASKAAHDQAESLREQEENLGSFSIAEMVNDTFSARDRAYKMLLRVEGA